MEQIKMMIEKSGLTQKEIAKKTGVKQGTISNIANGKNSQKLDTFVKIAKACGYAVVCRKLKEKKNEID